MSDAPKPASAATFNEADDQWPADFSDNGVVNILDVSSFSAPSPAVWAGGAATTPDMVNYNARWDLASPGLAVNILDVVAINRAVPHLGGVTPGSAALSLACVAD